MSSHRAELTCSLETLGSQFKGRVPIWYVCRLSPVIHHSPVTSHASTERVRELTPARTEPTSFPKNTGPR